MSVLIHLVCKVLVVEEHDTTIVAARPAAIFNPECKVDFWVFRGQLLLDVRESRTIPTLMRKEFFALEHGICGHVGRRGAGPWKGNDARFLTYTFRPREWDDVA